MTAAEIAEVLVMAISTVSRWLRQIGLGKRSRLEPPEPPNRYERKRPGELVHVDVKTLGRIAQVGHRITASRTLQTKDRRRNRRSGALGWEFCHVCVDDATRLAYAEVLPDERGATAAGFLRRAAAWFASMGITLEAVMSDNGLAIAPGPTPAPAPSSGSGICSPGPIGRGPTARPSASSRPSPTSGPMGRFTGPRRSGREPCRGGFPTTTSADNTAPSPRGRPQLGLPNWNNVVGNYT